MDQNLERLLEEFLGLADGALPDGYSAVLYGSAARGEYVPGWSDLNLLLVLERADGATLAELESAFRVLQGAGMPLPLISTREEMARSGDAFPIEITDMRLANRLLRGADPLEGLTVRRPDLRRALERELRGLLMRLRQGLVLQSGDAEALSTLAVRSGALFLALLRATLVLFGERVPADDGGTVTAGAARLRFDPRPVLAVTGARGQTGWRISEEVFEGWVAAVETTARAVDTYDGGHDT